VLKTNSPLPFVWERSGEGKVVLKNIFAKKAKKHPLPEDGEREFLEGSQF
jgi:hypothetical protein